jgi:hypothetical protein
MYSFHSDVESKSKLLKSLSQYGVETNVNRVNFYKLITCKMVTKQTHFLGGQETANQRLDTVIRH